MCNWLMCKHEFTLRYNLHRHVRQSHGNNWTCGICQTSFSCEDNFKHHMRTCYFKTTGAKRKGELFVHLLIRSFTHSLICSFTHSFIRSFTHSLIHSFPHLLICSFAHLLFDCSYFSHSKDSLIRCLTAHISPTTTSQQCGGKKLNVLEHDPVIHTIDLPNGNLRKGVKKLEKEVSELAQLYMSARIEYTTTSVILTTNTADDIQDHYGQLKELLKKQRDLRLKFVKFVQLNVQTPIEDLGQAQLHDFFINQ